MLPLGRQCRPAFGNMPDDQQQAARAEADRLLEMRHGGLIIAAESVTYAEIAAGNLRIGIELKGTMEAASGLCGNGAHGAGNLRVIFWSSRSLSLAATAFRAPMSSNEKSSLSHT